MDKRVLGYNRKEKKQNYMENIRKETALCGKVSDFPSSTPQRAYLFPVLAVQTGHRVHVTKFFSPVNPKIIIKYLKKRAYN